MLWKRLAGRNQAPQSAGEGDGEDGARGCLRESLRLNAKSWQGLEGLIACTVCWTGEGKGEGEGEGAYIKGEGDLGNVWVPLDIHKDSIPACVTAASMRRPSHPISHFGNIGLANRDCGCFPHDSVEFLMMWWMGQPGTGKFWQISIALGFHHKNLRE